MRRGILHQFCRSIAAARGSTKHLCISVTLLGFISKATFLTDSGSAVFKLNRRPVHLCFESITAVFLMCEQLRELSTLGKLAK